MPKLKCGSLGYGNFNKIAPSKALTASAPCRLDMGGTLDIPTLYFSLQSHQPVTVNLAINLRTQVRLTPHTPGLIKVSSRGFDSATFDAGKAPFNHPMGLIFAVAAYFGIHGIHIQIDSPSPPRSGLGGSSVAAVALVAALAQLGGPGSNKMDDRRKIALLAHTIEASVNMVPCGYQDQLAAAYGGVNAWLWKVDMKGSYFDRHELVSKSAHRRIGRKMLAAYSGVQHVSSDINGQWVHQFINGTRRETWIKMIDCVRRFSIALADDDIPAAVNAMNTEVDLRKDLTPNVLVGLGQRLVDVARETDCAARFTGAGGGGCIWALGSTEQIGVLKPRWEDILSTDSNAHLIEHGIDDQGVVVG